jgi:hypothetical protein
MNFMVPAAAPSKVKTLAAVEIGSMFQESTPPKISEVAIIR